MEAQLLDGRLVSDLLLKNVKQAATTLRDKKIIPTLVILLIGENPASLSYIQQKIKAAKVCGIDSKEIILPVTTTTKELVTHIETLNADRTVTGILVQLPLPDHIESSLIIRAIDPAKDVDGFQAYNIGKMFLSKEFEHLVPCTPQGVIELFKHYVIDPAGKNVVIVGRSNIVGKPLATMLINRDATVTVCHSKTNNLMAHTIHADILIVAIGKPRMITAEYVKEGAVVIDVGVNRIIDKNTEKIRLVGDVDFDSVSKKAAQITPVPGGVGPLTVACLMKNVITAAERQFV